SYLDGSAPDGWAELSRDTDEPLAVAPVPFDHPLYVLYSSGTTGLPKPIVHGHGGILLEHLKMLALHHDLGPGDRFFWYTTTGWISRRCPGVPTSAPASSAARRCYRSTRARSPAVAWARAWKRSTTRANRSPGSSASWSSPRRCRACRSASGAMTPASGTARR